MKGLMTLQESFDDFVSGVKEVNMQCYANLLPKNMRYEFHKQRVLFAVTSSIRNKVLSSSNKDYIYSASSILPERKPKPNI